MRNSDESHNRYTSCGLLRLELLGQKQLSLLETVGGRCRHAIKLRHRVELPEDAGESIRQAPHGPGRKFRALRLEVQPVDIGKRASGRFQLAIDERRVEDQPRRVISNLRFSPQFHLAFERLEIPLNPVHSNRKHIKEVEALAVLGEHRREHA